MSKPKEESRILNLKYAVDSGLEEMKTQVQKVHVMNERTEAQLGSLKNHLDQAEVSLMLLYPHL